jgi:hypothetical protein
MWCRCAYSSWSNPCSLKDSGRDSPTLRSGLEAGSGHSGYEVIPASAAARVSRPCGSPPGETLEVLEVLGGPGDRTLDASGCGLDHAEVVGRQFQDGGCGALLEALQPAGAGDRDDPGLCANSVLACGASSGTR